MAIRILTVTISTNRRTSVERRDLTQGQGTAHSLRFFGFSRLAVP